MQTQQWNRHLKGKRSSLIRRKIGTTKGRKRRKNHAFYVSRIVVCFFKERLTRINYYRYILTISLPRKRQVSNLEKGSHVSPNSIHPRLLLLSERWKEPTISQQVFHRKVFTYFFLPCTTRWKERNQRGKMNWNGLTTAGYERR